MNRTQKSRLVAVIVALPIGALWVWLGVQLVGSQWLRVWGWFTFALLLAGGAYGEYRRNVARSLEPGYLLQGSSAVVVRALRPEGQVRVGSELWSARARGDLHFEVGTRVRICGRDGLVLLVEGQRDESRSVV